MPGLEHASSLNVERGLRHTRNLKILEKYAEGRKIDDIAAFFGCTRGTVLRIARAAGFDKRPKTTKPWLKGCIRIMYAAELPIALIARELEVHESYVSTVAGEAGMLRRKFRPRKK